MSLVQIIGLAAVVFLSAWALGSWAAYRRGYARGWRDGWSAARSVSRVRGEGEL